MIKPKYYKFFLTVARNSMLLSYCKKRRVGAVIVDNSNNIVSFGYNGTVSGASNECEDEVDITCLNCKGEDKECITCSNTRKISVLKTDHSRVFHAEANAIMAASKRGFSLVGTSLVVTTEPCSECAKLIVGFGIKEVIIDTKYKTDAGVKFLLENNIDVKYSEDILPKEE